MPRAMRVATLRDTPLSACHAGFANCLLQSAPSAVLIDLAEAPAPPAAAGGSSTGSLEAVDAAFAEALPALIARVEALHAAAPAPVAAAGDSVDLLDLDFGAPVAPAPPATSVAQARAPKGVHSIAPFCLC